MKHLRVRFLIDLMVENRKVKFGLTVTSSEKVDRHGRINIIAYIRIYIYIYIYKYIYINILNTNVMMLNIRVLLVY